MWQIVAGQRAEDRGWKGTDVLFEHGLRIDLEICLRLFFSKKNPPRRNWHGGFYRKEFGGDLLSHPVTQAVPSAQRSLTSVFGMGTGVTSPLLPPKDYFSEK